MPPINYPVHTAEWRCYRCRKIPWDLSEWSCEDNRIGEQKFYIDFVRSLGYLEGSGPGDCDLCRNLHVRSLIEPKFQSRIEEPLGLRVGSQSTRKWHEIELLLSSRACGPAETSDVGAYLPPPRCTSS